MSFKEISDRIDKVGQQLTSSAPQLDSKKMKIEMQDLADIMVTEAELALNDDNFERAKCATILATLATTYEAHE